MISQISHPCLPNVGEALAALLGISLASQLHIDCFILEGNSEVVVSALQHSQISLQKTDFFLTCLLFIIFCHVSIYQPIKHSHVSNGIF